MRILHVHSGNLFGGVETVLRCFAQAQGAAPHNDEHEFAFNFDGRIAADLRALGSKVYDIGETHASDPFSVWRARKMLNAITRWGRFDATVVHSAWTLGLLGPAAVRPLVFYQHDVLNGSHWTERLARRAAPDLIIANSAYTSRSTPRVFAGQGAVVVHPPADLSPHRISHAERTAVRTRWGSSESNVALLIAARFEPWKGHRLLIEALARMHANPHWVLWVAGEAQRPHEIRIVDEVRTIALRAGIASRVHLLGHVENIPALMQSSDIYCQPNTEPEPFGLTFIEALHARIPVVTTELGGAAEILTPESGYLLEPSPLAVAHALETLIGDPERRRLIGRQSYERALHLCDPDRQTARVVASIERLRQARAA
jgi:glycosyltransferase involved in cell wall biosynthesis